MARVALVSQARAPPVALMVRVDLLVLVVRVGLVLRVRAPPTPSATLVVLVVRVVLVLVFGGGW